MKELDWANLPFGYMKTDYNVRIYYRNEQWGELEVCSEETIPMHMAATCLHYGQEAFEGLKAFRGKDGKVRIFRLEENAARLQSTCRGILMPELSTERFKEAILKVVKLNERFIPPYESGASLYIRPLLVGTGAQVGVHPASEYLFVVFVTPVGPYFKGGFSTNPYVIIREFDRAAPLGTGTYKVGGNYAASLRANKKAHDLGYACEFYLDAKEKKLGVEIEYKDFNGQNDATTLNQIGTQVVSDGYDAVIPIATLAAQCMTTACESTKTPVIYAAISDPAAADLTDIDYVTGTSDALNTQSIMDMMFAVQPDIQTVGLLYSNSEANSATPIAEAKAYLDAKGISYVEKTGNTNDEIMTAASSLVGQVDAVFTPTDNVVMAAAAAVSETLTKGGIPFYTGADSFVTAGAFATCGVNYTELGTYTADMALEVLETGTVPEYHVMDGGIITVNTETAAALGIDYSAFNKLAGKVVEVTTAE